MPANAFVITADEQTTGDLRRLASRWWVPVVLGALAAGIGLFLMFNLITAVATLAIVAALGILIEGVDEVVNADRYPSKPLAVVLGLIWITTGVAALVWPGITLWVLALLTGIGFLLGGVVQSVLAVWGRRNIDAWGLWLVLGLLSIAVGVACLAWPGRTILVLAILLGLRLVFRGIVLMVFGLGLRRMGAALS